ncbi:Aste57867_8131 [Aphanomyces stellatus]|uniref:Aste57867_8131 protein n=1 Tax=Aphanomyces stellatus TaxID=120398 RepID=A0A485KJJ6_9STRA|nr:hypothetical protein As57867_008101 [Aphanomyces stellatus]VFT85020.1 Aste57867_8131 [Aphanomyces stellatus]
MPPSAMELCVRWIHSDGVAHVDAADKTVASLHDSGRSYSAFERWKHVKLWLRFALHAWHTKALLPSTPTSPSSLPFLDDALHPAETPPVVIRELYEPVQVLGKGAFGLVVLSRKASTNELVAIKSIDKSKVCPDEAARLLTEREILSRAQHPFVVQLERAFESPTHYHFVLEYCPGGDLYSLLETSERLDAPLALFYTASIASALLYMHHVCGIAYRDLKPENILLDAKGFVRLTDFGLAKQAMDAYSTTTFSFCGSVDYMAPEIILGCGYGLAADIWSLGCVVYEMFTGLPPFYTTAGRAVLFERICRGDVVYPASLIPPDACTFIAKCLQLDPTKRGTIEELLDHPFLASIDWYQLAIQQVPVPHVPALAATDDTHHFGDQFTSQPLPHDALVDVAADDDNLLSAFDWTREPAPSPAKPTMPPPNVAAG